MNIELKLWNIVINYNDRNDFMELNYLKDMAEELLEYGNIQFLEPLSTSEAVYLKKLIREIFNERGSKKISLVSALNIIDINTKKEEYSYQNNNEAVNKVNIKVDTLDNDKSKIKIDLDDGLVQMASDILIGNNLGLLKPLEEYEALKIVEAAKLLIEAHGQICYKRSLQGVVDYVNRELGNGRKVVMHSDNGEESFELLDDYDYIPIWHVDDMIDPVLIGNDTVKELAKILVATGDLNLAGTLPIDYTLAIFRECIMLLSEKSNNINLNNLIFYLNLNTDGNFRIAYTKYSPIDLKKMIMAREELIVDPKIIREIEKKLKNGEINLNPRKK